MSVSIFAWTSETWTPASAVTHEAKVTREEARLLVEAVARIDGAAWPVFVGDENCGWVA